ncbi:MAG TPA: hypothetical protein VGG04_15510 [Candidatus Sulfotelmatobacter sp.]|jgi:hypothetical protein
MKTGKRITPTGLQRYTNLVQSNPSFDRSFSEIADLRGAETIDINAEEMIKAADKLDPFSHDACRAFVVQTKTQAHAARMHKILRSQRNFQIFYSFEEAEQWIRKQNLQADVRR